MAKLKKTSSEKKPKFGSGKGMFKMKKNFDEPIEDFKDYVEPMSKQELKDEISKVLDNFSDNALSELLVLLREIDSQKDRTVNVTSSLNKILSEDKELLKGLLNDLSKRNSGDPQNSNKYFWRFTWNQRLVCS